MRDFVFIWAGEVVPDPSPGQIWLSLTTWQLRKKTLIIMIAMTSKNFNFVDLY